MDRNIDRYLDVYHRALAAPPALKNPSAVISGTSEGALVWLRVGNRPGGSP